jgi:hypothetical protein
MNQVVVRPPYAEPKDELIIWPGPELLCEVIDAWGSLNCYFYEGSNGIGPTVPPYYLLPPYDSTCGYYVNASTLGFVRVISDDSNQYGFPGNNVPFSDYTFVIKYEELSVVSGSPVSWLNYNPGRENQWWDLFRCDIRIAEPSVPPYNDELLTKITIGRWDGTGDPWAGTAGVISGTERSRNVRFHAQII